MENTKMNIDIIARIMEFTPIDEKYKILTLCKEASISLKDDYILQCRKENAEKVKSIFNSNIDVKHYDDGAIGSAVAFYILRKNDNSGWSHGHYIHEYTTIKKFFIHMS